MYQYNGELPFGLCDSYYVKRIWQLDVEYLNRQVFPHQKVDVHTDPVQLLNKLDRFDDAWTHWEFNIPNELMADFEVLRDLHRNRMTDDLRAALAAYDKRRIQFLPDRVRQKYDEAYIAYMFMINTLITKPNSNYSTLHKLLGKYPLNMDLPMHPVPMFAEIDASVYTREFARTTSLTIECGCLLKWDMPNASNRVKIPIWL